MVQGRQILTFYTTMVLIANDCGYKILRFWANPQKYQTLVPAKIVTLRYIAAYAIYTHYIIIILKMAIILFAGYH
jgi:hypothetical protein